MVEDGVIKKMIKASLESIFESELCEHFGYEKYAVSGRNSSNGKSTKTLENENGEIEIAVPRDRNGSFGPVIVKKYKRSLGPIEDKIISIYTKGMSTRDVKLIL